MVNDTALSWATSSQLLLSCAALQQQPTARLDATSAFNVDRDNAMARGVSVRGQPGPRPATTQTLAKQPVANAQHRTKGEWLAGLDTRALQTAAVGAPPPLRSAGKWPVALNRAATASNACRDTAGGCDALPTRPSGRALFDCTCYDGNQEQDRQLATGDSQRRKRWAEEPANCKR